MLRGMSMRSECPNEATLVRFSDGELDEPEVAALTVHLDHCEECRELLALAAGDSGPQPAQQRVGRYRLLEVLGSGSMGVVHAAEDPELDRAVAIKLVHRAQAQLVDEARAMARVSHPNVVQVFDVGQAEGRTYIVMERVDGRDLRAWSMDRPWRQRVACFIGCARGLAAAHAAGLVHRDFKPSNVLVDRHGCPKVTDFGLVGLAQESIGAQSEPVEESDPVRTRSGLVVGTPAYMSPEQFHSGGLTVATDQFSLCVALCEALCGKRPTHGATLAELAASAESAQERVGELCEAVPKPIVEVLERGLAPRPEDRYPSMTALADRLQRSLDGSSARWRRGLAAVAAVVALGVLGWAALTRSAAVDPSPTGDPASRAPLFLRAEVARLDALVEDARQHYEAARYEAAIDLLEGDVAALEGIAWAPTWVDGQLLWAACEGVQGRRQAQRSRLLRAHHRAAVAGLDRRAALAATFLIDAHGSGAGDYAAAEHWLDIAISSARRLDDTSLEANAVYRGAFLALQNSHFEDALELANRASDLLGETPDAVEYQRLAELDGLRGYVGLYRRDLDAARAAFSSQLRRLDAHLEPNHPKRVPALLGLAQVALAQGDWDEAERLLDTRAEVVSNTLGPRSVPYARNLAQQSRLAQGRGDLETALRRTTAAREIFAEALGAHHPDVARQHARVGHLYLAQERLEAAHLAYVRALDECVEFSGEASYCAVAGHTNVGTALLRMGRDDEARHHLGAALRLSPEVLGPEHALIDRAAVGLAELELREGRYADAGARLRGVLSRAGRGPDEADTRGRAAFALARVLVEDPDADAAQRDEARVLLREALQSWASGSAGLEQDRARAWGARTDFRPSGPGPDTGT